MQESLLLLILELSPRLLHQQSLLQKKKEQLLTQEQSLLLKEQISDGILKDSLNIPSHIQLCIYDTHLLYHCSHRHKIRLYLFLRFHIYCILTSRSIHFCRTILFQFGTENCTRLHLLSFNHHILH